MVFDARHKSNRCPHMPDKEKYDTFEIAREIADRREPEEGKKLYVYACSTCGTFHISKKPGDELILEVDDRGTLYSTGWGTR